MIDFQRMTPLVCLLSVLLWVAPAASSDEGLSQQQQSGPLTVRLTLTPKRPLIGDTVTLSIEVIAEEGVEVLMPDFGDALERFSIVDFAPRQTIDDQGRTVSTQTYRLDPPHSGEHVIPPILVEYVDRRDGKPEAPDDLDAYEVLTDRIPFEVESVLPTDASTELKPPLGRLDPLEPPTTSNWPWFTALSVVGLIALSLLIRALMLANRRQRRRSAYEVAKARLETILAAPRSTAEEIDQFFVGLSFAIRQYIEDRFEMRAPELTTEEFLNSIGESPDFSTEHQRLLRNFLRQADLVKFARAQPTAEEMKHAIDLAEQFLEETREQLPTANSTANADDPRQGGPSAPASSTPASSTAADSDPRGVAHG